MVCEIFFCSEFSNIPDKAGRKTRIRKRRRTQAIAKRYAFHANTTITKRRTQANGKRFVFHTKQIWERIDSD